MEIKFTKSENLKKKPEPGQKLGFGHIFTDYMLVMPYDEGQGCMILKSSLTLLSSLVLLLCVFTMDRLFLKV